MSNTIFSGNSRYANDFQQVIDRAVAIASLPLKQLQSQRAVLDDQVKAWNALDSKFSDLKTAFDRIGVAVDSSSFSAKSSDETVAKARLGSNPLPGLYSIEVLNTGRQTNTISADGLLRVADPFTQSISAASSLTLVVDGANYVINTNPPSLAAIAAQINGAHAGVLATIINVGTTAEPDYRLSVQGAKLGAVAISLSDGSQVILNTLSMGYLASYKINGLATAINSDSRSVTVAPGLEADLAKVGSTDITVARTQSSIKDALSSFIQSFNGAVDELDKNRGTANGALNGQSLVSSLAQSLRTVGAYSGADSISSLASIGITFDRTGKLKLNTAEFDAATANKVNDLVSFLGSPSTGGFLKAASDVMKELQDSSDGQITNAISSVKKQLTSQDDAINAQNDRIALMRDTLLQKMAQADALIASLEQQVNYMNGLFTAMRSSNGR